MAKIDDYMRGRTEGMELALRIVKDKGIEELEKEVKFRTGTGISLNLTRQELNAASNKIKDMTLDTFTILGVASLHDVYGFGEKRCQRFIDKMAEGVKLLAADMATWEDYRNEVNKRLHMNLQIRWND